jgi:DNA-binding transcriptional ArsR family regulator
MDTRQAVAALGALAQETRLSIFRMLVQAGPAGLAAGRLSEELKVPPNTLSFHLKELSHAALVTARPESRFVYYSADFGQMAALMTFLTENCCKECLSVVETALGQRCGPNVRPASSSRRKS